MLCVKVTRPNYMGDYGYIQSVETLRDALDNEFECFDTYAEVGDKILFEVIEMDEEEYNNLPDFEGW